MDATDCHDNWSDVNNAWGALNAEVSFNLTNKFSLGPSYTFSSTTAGDGAHKSNIAYHAIMLNGRYKYWKSLCRICSRAMKMRIIALISECRWLRLAQRWASEADSRYMVS